MTEVSTWLTAVPATAAAIAGAVYLVGRVRAAVRTLDVIERVVSRELEHNHGSSMKDDVHGMAVALGEVQRTTDDIVAAFRRHYPDDPMFWKDKKR